MNDTNIKDELQRLTKDMLYISEGDYELDVQEWGHITKAGAKEQISGQTGTDAGNVREGDAAGFFERTINALDPQDEFATALAKQYKELQRYLKATFSDMAVFRAGKIQVHIFICCFTKAGDCFVIHTVSVET